MRCRCVREVMLLEASVRDQRQAEENTSEGNCHTRGASISTGNYRQHLLVIAKCCVIAAGQSSQFQAQNFHALAKPPRCCSSWVHRSGCNAEICPLPIAQSTDVRVHKTKQAIQRATDVFHFLAVAVSTDASGICAKMFSEGHATAATSGAAASGATRVCERVQSSTAGIPGSFNAGARQRPVLCFPPTLDYSTVFLHVVQPRCKFDCTGACTLRSFIFRSALVRCTSLASRSWFQFVTSQLDKVMLSTMHLGAVVPCRW